MQKRFTIKHAAHNQTDDTTTNALIEINLIEIASMLIRRKRLIIGGVLAVMIITAGLSLLLPNFYTSHASLLPSGNPDNLGDLKSLAGLTTSMNIGDNSSELFPVILRSQRIRDAVLDTEFDYTHNGTERSISLPDYFGQTNRDLLYDHLAGITSIGKNKKNGVITIDVETKFPWLSQAIAEKYIEALEEYNSTARRSRAKDNADYLHKQLKTAKAELNQAEDQLEQFQAVNLDWAGSTNPEIVKHMSRFQRDVEAATTTYLYLLKEFEIARFEAQKDIPIVRTLDEPSLPQYKSRPRRLLIVLAAGTITGLGLIMLLILQMFVQRLGAGPNNETYQRFGHDFARAFPRTSRLAKRLIGPLKDQPAGPIEHEYAEETTAGSR